METYYIPKFKKNKTKNCQRESEPVLRCLPSHAPPHPPQCAHWGTFPSRGRLRARCRLFFLLTAQARLAFRFRDRTSPKIGKRQGGKMKCPSPSGGRWQPPYHGRRLPDEGDARCLTSVGIRRVWLRSPSPVASDILPRWGRNSLWPMVLHFFIREASLIPSFIKNKPTGFPVGLQVLYLASPFGGGVSAEGCDGRGITRRGPSASSGARSGPWRCPRWP